MILKSDRYAIAACIKACNDVDIEKIRMARIPNTLEIGEIWVSESMLDDALQNPNIEILTEAAPMPFDEHGNLW